MHGGHKSFNAQSEAEAITFMMEEAEVLLGLFLEIINRDVIVTNMAGLVVFPVARTSLVENLANVCYRANRGNTWNHRSKWIWPRKCSRVASGYGMTITCY